MPSSVHSQVFAATEHNIETDLQKNPNDLHSVFQQLTQLRKTEPEAAFQQDLTAINQDLQSKNLLPNLQIVEAPTMPDGFNLQPFEASPPAAPPAQPSDSSGGGGMGSGNAGYGDSTGVGAGGSGGGGGGGGGGDSSAGGAPSGGGGGGGGGGGDSSAGGAPSGGTGSTYDGAVPGNPADVQANAKLVGQIAQQMGVDPVSAVAAMLVESGGNAQAKGDYSGGTATSFGLFQLHEHGELDNLPGNLQQQIQEAFNPGTNAQQALSHFPKGGPLTGDQVASAQGAQNDHGQYAAAYNAALPRARQLLGVG